MLIADQQSEMKIIDCLWHIKTNIYRIIIWYSQPKNASYCEDIETMKSLSTKNKASNNYQVKSQEFTIFYNNKKIEQTTSTMSRNSNRIQFCHSALQRKKQ